MHEISESVLSKSAEIAYAALLPSALVTALAVCAPALSVPDVAARLVAEVWVSASILFVASRARALPSRALLGALVPLTLLAALFAQGVAATSAWLLLPVTTSLLVVGLLLGGYIGGLLRYPGMMLVVAYVATLGDCFSVLHPHGFTRFVMGHERALSLLTLSFPALGTERIVPLVGVGDVVFACLYVAAARVNGLSVTRTLVAIACAIAIVVLAVELTAKSLPAVPFLSCAVIVVHPEARRLPPRESRRIALNLAFVTLVLGGLLLAARAAPP